MAFLQAVTAVEPGTTVPAYQVGQEATNDVITPLPLMVFDPERTAATRRAEAQKIPPVFRFLEQAPRQMEDSLRNGFAHLRSEFVALLETNFSHRVPLLTVEVAQPRFQEAVQAFRQRHQDLAADLQLYELWAFGDSGDALLDTFLGYLRRQIKGHVRADVLPPGERLTTGNIRLITVEHTNRMPTLALVDQEGRNLARTNLVTLSRARQEALRGVADEELPTARFVAGFLQPNCVFDTELTRQARARRTDAIHIADRYESGQILVKQGDQVTSSVKLALDELRARLVAAQAEAVVVLERSHRVQAEAATAVAQHTMEGSRRLNRWLAGSLIGLGLICLLLFLVWRSGRKRWAQTVLEPGMALVPAGDSLEGELHWRQRALAAEAKAERAAALLRTNLLPHMARWMMNELVQRLLSQHSSLKDSQEQAEKEVAELALRLDQLQAPLSERLRAYEKRIAELELELAAKGEPNVELIKAKIESTRRRLSQLN